MTERKDIPTQKPNLPVDESAPQFQRRTSMSFKLGLAFLACSVLSIGLAFEISYELSGNTSSSMLLALVFMLQVFFTIYLSRRFGASLKRTAEMVERVASGDLEQPIAGAERDLSSLEQTHQ